MSRPSWAGQFAAVDEMLTGRENLQMFGRLFDLSAADARRWANELLERFDIADAADRPARTYSGGMRATSRPRIDPAHPPARAVVVYFHGHGVTGALLVFATYPILGTIVVLTRKRPSRPRTRRMRRTDPVPA